MKNCVFCDIASGKLPCYKVFENEQFLGFLDIYPRVKGHSLLIPKKHFTWTYDVPNFDQYWQAALELTKKMKNILNPSFITYATHGLEVPHAHIHIMPRAKDTSFVPQQITVKKEEMIEIAKQLMTDKI